MLTGYEDGYYVQLQSEIKTSELKYEKTVDGVKYYLKPDFTKFSFNNLS